MSETNKSTWSICLPQRKENSAEMFIKGFIVSTTPRFKPGKKNHISHISATRYSFISFLVFHQGTFV